jgi:hypothetical protein
MYDDFMRMVRLYEGFCIIELVKWGLRHELFLEVAAPTYLPTCV